MMTDSDLGLEDLDDDSGEETVMTAAEVLKRLEQAWLGEKFAPELLESKSDIFECMMDQLHEMEENIHRAKKGDFKVSIHRMEIDRIRYILSSYLRIRLDKIEKYTEHILESEKTADTPRMSPEELAYAKEYHANMENHLKSVALRHMPPNLQALDPKLTTIYPNLDSYVFFKVNDNVEGVMVEEETADAREEIIDLEKGDQHLMRYRPIAGLVTSDTVSLI